MYAIFQISLNQQRRLSKSNQIHILQIGIYLRPSWGNIGCTYVDLQRDGPCDVRIRYVLTDRVFVSWVSSFHSMLLQESWLLDQGSVMQSPESPIHQNILKTIHMLISLKMTYQQVHINIFCLACMHFVVSIYSNLKFACMHLLTK